MSASELPVLIDFWAPWCAPCRQMAPLIDQVAGDYADRVTVLTCNSDENPATAARFSVTSLPTLVVLQGGRPVKQLSGARPRHRLLRELAEWLE